MTHYNGMVLSLAKDVSRRQSFYSQLEKLKVIDLSFTTFTAIDASTPEGKSFIDEHFDFAQARKNYGRNLSYGEAACSLSHIEIMRLLSHEVNYAVICEDDAKFSPNINKLSQILDASPYDIIIFGESKVKSFNGGKRQLRENPLQLFPQKIAGLKLGVVYKFYTPGTVGYAVSSRYIQMLLSYLSKHKCSWLADDYKYIFNAIEKEEDVNLTCGYVMPRMVIEDPHIRSHLENERLCLIEEANGVYVRPPLLQRLIPKFYFIQKLHRRYIAYRNLPQFDAEMLAKIKQHHQGQ